MKQLLTILLLITIACPVMAESYVDNGDGTFSVVKETVDEAYLQNRKSEILYLRNKMQTQLADLQALRAELLAEWNSINELLEE